MFTVGPKPTSLCTQLLCILTQVGTGFSFTDSDKGYSTNEDQVADNLYEYVC